MRHHSTTHHANNARNHASRLIYNVTFEPFIPRNCKPRARCARSQYSDLITFIRGLFISGLPSQSRLLFIASIATCLYFVDTTCIQRKIDERDSIGAVCTARRRVCFAHSILDILLLGNHSLILFKSAEFILRPFLPFD